MKKLLKSLLASAVIFGSLTSCVEEQFMQPEEPSVNEDMTPEDNGDVNYVSFNLVSMFEGDQSDEDQTQSAETKVTPMDDEGRFAWEGGEAVQVLYEGSGTDRTVTPTVTDGKAYFNFEAPAGDVYLVYPATSGVILEGGNLIVPMPAIQKGSLNGLFVAKANNNDATAKFCHPISYYKLSVDGDGSDVSRVEISSKSESVLTAKSLTIGFDDDKLPTLGDVTDGASQIAVDFSETSEGNYSGDYFIPVVPRAESHEANDITFQFYRGTANEQEKAGGYVHNKVIDTPRASVINWASLPAKATNRYMVESTSGKKTGSYSNPWTIDEFKNFLSSDADPLVNGVKIHAAAGRYALRNINIKLKSSIKLYILGAGSEKAPDAEDYSGTTRFDGGRENCLFGQNADGTPADQIIVFKDIRFQYGHRSNENGGVFYIKYGKFVFEDCNFNNCKTLTSGKNGGVANIYNNAVVDFKDCVFQSNEAAGSGGVLNIGGSSNVNVYGCTFKNNKASNSSSGTPGGGAVYVYGGTANLSYCEFSENNIAYVGGCVRVDGGSARIDNTVFSGNAGSPRGAALGVRGANAVCFLHNVTMTDNTTTDRWGTAIQTLDGATVCANNLTVAGNDRKDNTDGYPINGYCNLVLVNSTIVDEGDAVVRFDNASASAWSLNSIIMNSNTSTSKAVVFGQSAKFTSGGYSIVGSSSGAGTFTLSSDGDQKDKTFSTDTWSWNPDLYYYTWNGSFGGIDYSTSGINPSDIQTLVFEKNQDFVNWVTGIDADAFKKDIRGNDRGSRAWPGSYNN